MKGTVVDTGVKKTVTTHRTITTNGNMGRTVQMNHLFLTLGTVLAGALRGLIPGIIMVIDILDVTTLQGRLVTSHLEVLE